MKFADMVTVVNRLNQTSDAMTYSELRQYFDEAIDELNQAIFEDVFDYFPDSTGDDNYIGLPNRFQQRYICYFVAAKTLSEEDDYDDQRVEYETMWRSALAQYANYYFDEIAPQELESPYAFNVDSFDEYWIEEDEVE